MTADSTILATVFIPPNGRRDTVRVKNIRAEAARYLNENNIRVSMEEICGMGQVVYFGDGTLLDDDETPDEIIILSNGVKSCEDCMDEGVERLKKRKETV